jgi:hypothetical protein
MAQCSELLGVALQFAHVHVSRFIDSTSQVSHLEPLALSTPARWLATSTKGNSVQFQ